MKSAVFYGKHDLRVEEYAQPEVGPEDVLIQVKACGICGTDVHIYEGDKGAAEVTPPTILGHEFSGVVVKTGDKVTEYRPVTGYVSIPTVTAAPVMPAGTGRLISVKI